ncbi:MAG: cobaltochelatase subunit CobN [Candidatus Methanomethylophilaceae archaeon]|nr:cobaltochelatase subunit CobN [Candidatus Methanomethylophilaceae archaeon]
MFEFNNRGDVGSPDFGMVYISVGMMDAENFGSVVSGMAGIPARIRMTSANSESIDASGYALSQMMDALDSADVLLMRTHGDPKYMRTFERVLSKATSRGITVFIYCDEDDVMSEYRKTCDLDEEGFRIMRKYLGLAGDDNYRNAIAWMCRRATGLDFQVEGPVVPRAQGIFHPDCPDGIDEESYLSRIPDGRPVVGILFRQHYWISHNHSHIDALVRSLESKGAYVVPVFCLSAPNDVTESIGMPAAIDRYFKKDGKAVIDSLVMSFRFSQLAAACPDGRSERNFFADLGVPIIQAPFVLRPPEDWAASQGMTANELATTIIWPEFDGQIIAPPFAFLSLNDEGKYATRFVQDRVDRIADLAIGWARLRRMDNSQKRVAIMLNMSSGESWSMGGAAGLDTFESLRGLLLEMRKEGYAVDFVPETSEELVHRMMSGLTNDLETVPMKGFSERAAGWVSSKDYSELFSKLPESRREQTRSAWGDPPGRFMVDRGRIAVPGLMDGNVLIGFQPARGDPEDGSEETVHSTDLPVPHHYIAYYRWVEDVFKADVLIHLGTHGSLEWLPGKNSGLSSECWPDIVQGAVPNLYSYIIDDPGEGVGAKRRTSSVIVDYMVPPMTRSGSYDDLEELDSRLQAFMQARVTGRRDKMGIEAREIRRLADGLSLSLEGEVEDHVQELYELVSDIKEAPIKNGLHVLGRVPEREELQEMAYVLTRLRNGDVPSLRGVLASADGLDFETLKDSPSGYTGGILNGTLIDGYDAKSRDVVRSLSEAGFDLEAAELDGSLRSSPEVVKVLEFVCDDLVPRIRMMDDEIRNLIRGMDGGYVDKGPSGSPTRGNSHLLPTGRNFFSLDPDTIPSEASWEIGRRMADEMLERSLGQLGHYPETVGIIIWATDTIKTGGDDIAYMLYLLGVRPVWASANGKVSGLEPIPLEELGRPRIDVTMRMTGMFRDSFPGLIDLLDEAVRIVMNLDEDEESNLIRRHVYEEVTNDILEGIPDDEARLRASVRLFGDAPGNYGCGTGEVIESSDWKEVGDIADVYTRFGAFSYSRGMNGKRMDDAFVRRMSKVEVTVKNSPDRGMDVLDVDDYYEILGGMNAAVRAYGGRKPLSFMGDSSDRDRTRLRTVEEETSFVIHSRVLNPKWAEGMRKHGFRGAQEFAKLTGALLGWSATSDTVEPWVFESVTRRFIEDDESRRWISENNPYALKSMLDDLLESIERGLWDAPDDLLDVLKDAYLEAEEKIEDLTDN